MTMPYRIWKTVQHCSQDSYLEFNHQLFKEISAKNTNTHHWPLQLCQV